MGGKCWRKGGGKGSAPQTWPTLETPTFCVFCPQAFENIYAHSEIKFVYQWSLSCYMAFWKLNKHIFLKKIIIYFCSEFLFKKYYKLILKFQNLRCIYCIYTMINARGSLKVVVLNLCRPLFHCVYICLCFPLGHFKFFSQIYCAQQSVCL